jgi:hypothetical protein
MACSCSASKQFIVTTKTGDKIPVTSEVAAKAMAQKTGGSYAAA